MCKHNKDGVLTCTLGDRDEKCFSCKPIQENKECGEFWKTKDMLYNFHSTALGIPITSKTHWRRELKSRGLTDDFVQSGSARVKEIEKATAPKSKMSREEIKSAIRSEMKQRGIYDRKKLFLEKAKTWRVECQ